ncbi:MAG: antitoxin of toxin-antitoxin stability system [Microbacterium sp.]|nr:antitoxin of toxin-antitoxin stability system [Microbacterium sp.]
MMYNVLEARNSLSKLIADVESGIEVTTVDAAPQRPRNAFATWLQEHPLTPERARPADEIEAIIAENRAAGS